jgi:hypothetical protein
MRLAVKMGEALSRGGGLEFLRGSFLSWRFFLKEKLV